MDMRHSDRSIARETAIQPIWVRAAELARRALPDQRHPATEEATTLRGAECECPEFCLLDHSN